MYQGNGSNNVFPIPMVKGFYGTISVAFVRRGKAVYDFNPTTWTINGNLFAWDVGSGSFFYTNTAAPSTGAVAYNEYGVANGYEVASISGTSIEFSKTGSANVSGTRDTTADIDENSVLTWTGDVLNIGDFIVIQRTTILQQPYDFPNNQQHIEKSDNNMERQIQELADKLESVLSIDPTFSIDSTKMTPQEWLETVLRSTDKSVRELKKYNDQLFYSSVDPESLSGDKIWYALPNSENIKTFRRATMTVDGAIYKFVEALDTTTGTWFPVGGCSPVRNGVQSDTIVGIEYDLEEGLIITLHEGETVSIIPFSAELKEIYDAAAEMAHTHDNKEDLDKVSGENTGDETETTIKTKLGITTLSGSNTGDQDLSGYALLLGATFSGQISAPNIIAGNTIYGGTISANLDTITKSGLYTCYGTATGVPSADYSWFVLHQNSNVGTTSATQRAVAYDNTTLRVYERVKMTTWGTWVLQGSGGGSAILPTGTCSTAGSTAAKEVTVAGYTETAGACALITFENKNTVAGALTLNINSGGAKSILHADGTAISATNPAYFIANCPIQFCYDGTGYRFKQEVVKTYRNGANWYKLGNDGWVEQGGESASTGTSTPKQVNLLITMADTQYNKLLTSISASINASVIGHRCVESNTSYIKVLSTYALNTSSLYLVDNFIWRVEGYAIV